MNYILAIDQGTTATTALIMDAMGQVIASIRSRYPHFPKRVLLITMSTKLSIRLKRPVLGPFQMLKSNLARF